MNNNNLPQMEGPICPIPLYHEETIVLGHGSGGKMMNDLIQNIFLPKFSNPILNAGNDAGLIDTDSHTRLAVSTDSHVVWPLFFPGGDIGKLAVCGTVNDVAMLGATPKYLTAGFILEEGLEIEILERVVQSMKHAAEEANVKIVAGDTKVVQHNKADGLYITTAGVGIVIPGMNVGGAQAEPGDIVILSGPIGDHGIAVLGARGELGFESSIQSDCAPLNQLIAAMMNVSKNIHVLRDPTRGGVASTLNEIAVQSGVGITLKEACIPVRPPVQAACEMLGFDPLYIANEGKLIAIVCKEDVTPILDIMHKTKYGEEAVVIGKVSEEHPGRVLMETSFSSTRVVDVLAGEILPRIC